MHKSKKILTMLLVLVAVCLVACSAPEGGNIRQLNGITILVDPGHGDTDVGTIGTSTGRYEKDVNLEIALKLRNVLQAKGVTVVMTREDDEPLGPAVEPDLKTRKEADMQCREAIIDSANAQLLVSIHQNNFDDPDVKGPQVFYLKNANDGKEYGVQFAQALQAAINEVLAVESPRSIHSGNWRLLKKGGQPGVIVECGFFSNQEEDALLQTEEYQNKLVQAIVKGIENYVTEYGV